MANAQMPRRMTYKEWSSPQPCLVDAQHVLGFTRAETLDRSRELAHRDRMPVPLEPKRARTIARASVDVHGLGLKTEARPNPERGVVHGELTDPGDRSDKSIHEVE
jgi:hypothetical protein